MESIGIDVHKVNSQICVGELLDRLTPFPTRSPSRAAPTRWSCHTASATPAAGEG